MVGFLFSPGVSRSQDGNGASTIYCDYETEDRELLGVAEELVRVSVGIEHKDDIIEDFAQALGEA